MEQTDTITCIMIRPMIGQIVNKCFLNLVFMGAILGIKVVGDAAVIWFSVVGNFPPWILNHDS